jgi:large repetitive protein
MAGSGDEGTGTFTVNLLAGASDVDAGETPTLKVSGLDAATLPAGFTLNSNGTLTVDTNDAAYNSLTPGAKEVVTLSYNVVDVHGATVAQTATITITGTNDAPVLTASMTAHTYVDTDADDSFTPIGGSLTAADPDQPDTKAYSIGACEPSTSGTHPAGSGWVQKVGVYGTLYLNSASGLYEYVPDDAAIEGLQSNASDSFTLVVTDGSAATDSETLVISIRGANTVSGDEDTEIALAGIDPSVLAVDETTVSLLISGIPSGAVLTDGVRSFGTLGDAATSVDVLSWDRTNLSITPPADSDANFTLAVTATSLNGTDEVTTESSITVVVNATADEPTLSLGELDADGLPTGMTEGLEDTEIALPITVGVADGDTLASLAISEIPLGSTLRDSAGHSFTASAATGTSNEINDWELASLTIQPPANYNGDFFLKVIATSAARDSDGAASGTATVEDYVFVAVEPVSDVPVAANASVSTDEDVAITTGRLPAATDAESASSTLLYALVAVRPRTAWPRWPPTVCLHLRRRPTTTALRRSLTQ